MTEKHDRPDFQTDEFQQMTKLATIVRDVGAGIATVRDRGVSYLPRHPNEQWDDYLLRLQTAVLYNGVQKTVEGLSGMVFRRDPVLSDEFNATIAAHLEDIDLLDTHVDVFAKRLLEDMLIAGHAGILVDYPPVPVGITAAEEAALRARPYWLAYRLEDIVSVRTDRVGGRMIATQIVLRERAEEAKGAYGSETVTRYRVLAVERGVVTWRVLRIVDDEDVVEEASGVITNQTEIPFVFAYARRTGFATSAPPLYDLAETNLAHYRLLSDHLYAMHLANIPVGVLTNVDPDTEITVSPNTWLKLPRDSTFTWEAHEGRNFAENREQLAEFKSDMAAMGLAMLQRETRAAETAEAKRMDKADADSALATVARGLQDALEQAIIYHANYLRIETPGTIAINRDFEELSMSPDEIRAYSELVAAGQMPLATMWRIMRERHALPDDFDEEVALGEVAAPLELVEA